MYRMGSILGILLTLMLLALPTAAQETPSALEALALPDEFTTQTDPASLIGAYYNAISRGDYSRAFGYWEQAPGDQTEAQFAAGFADTVNATTLVRLPIFIDAGAGNLHANIPALVIGEQVDGSTEFYAGCFVAHKTNVPVGDAPEPDGNWYLQSAELAQVASPDLTALDSVCAEEYSLADDPNSVPDQLDPIQLVRTYFSQIASGAAVDAQALWENPPGDLFQAAYGNQINAVESLNVYVNPVVVNEGAAGSIYANLAALVVTNAPDGSQLYIPGCYTARLSNVPSGDAETPNPNWHFYNATLTMALDAQAGIDALNGICTGRG
jgi:hypothetical protein